MRCLRYHRYNRRQRRRRFLPQIVEVLLSQLRESENDDLLDVLSKLIEQHGEAFKP